MLKINILTVFLFVVIFTTLQIKESYAQFYIDVSQGYNFSLKSNKGIDIVNKNYYSNITQDLLTTKIFSESYNTNYDTTKMNFAKGLYYEVNTGYNFHKYFGISIGYQYMSAESNPGYFNNNKTQINSTRLRTLIANKDTIIKTINNNTLIYTGNKDDTISNSNYYYQNAEYELILNNYRLNMHTRYAFKKITIFGELSINYLDINFKKKYKSESIEFTDKNFRYTGEYLNNDPHSNTRIYEYTIYGNYEKSYTKTEGVTEYKIKNNISLSYGLGVQYSINNHFALLFKIRYNNYKSSKEIKAITNETLTYERDTEGSEIHTSTYTETSTETTDSQYFFPAIKFSFGIRYTFNKFGKGGD